MYATLKGTITMIKPSYVVLENQGVGFLMMTPNPYAYHVGDEIMMHTHHYVREDLSVLYGFSTLEHKELFLKLLNVSGIGPKSALSILAADSITEVLMAIEDGDVKKLTKFPGIGMKSAQQIILDLKGKLLDISSDSTVKVTANDAVDALVALGYNKTEINKALKTCDLEQPVEKIIKQALAKLLK